jgi:protein translocase SecG subunit
MQSLITSLNIIFSVLLVILVLIQRTNTDAGGAFGQDGGSFAFKRRGSEKTLYNMTVVMAILFAISLAIRILI